MRTENLFRFVAIRAPLPAAPPASALVPPPRDAFVGRIRARVGAGGSLEQVRRAQATEFMESSDYVMRNPQWKPFLAIESWVQRLLAEISPGEDLRAAIERLLATPVGSAVNLEAFVASAEFSQLKGALWDSYYSNVTLLNRRPHDRPRLLFWIRFWRLMERLANGEQGPALLAELVRWQPTVPHILVRAERSASDTSSEPTVDIRATPLAARRGRIATTTARLNELRTAHTHITQLANAKLAAAAAHPAPARAAAAHDDDSAEDEETALRTEEIDPTILTSLRRLELPPEGADALDLASRLEDRIAAAHLELSRLRRVEQIVTVGGVLVRRHRRLTNDELAGEDER